MKPLALVFTILLAGVAGWFAHSRLASGTAHEPTPAVRKVLFYQSPMHPWIRSDKPGKCTVCGMDLVPVYDGETPAGDHSMSLASNVVTAIGVKVAEARRQPLERTLRFTGTIDDDDSRHRILSAYVEGRIDALFLHHDGAEIAAGDRLASIYSAPLLAAVREYLALRTRSGNAGVESDSLIASARTRLRQLGLSAEQIDALPTTVTPETLTFDIRSPMGGTVVKRIAYAGQYVKEGDPLFELGDFSVMWLKFDAYERDLAWLQPGQVVEVTTPALPGEVFTNRIRFIDPNLDPASASAKVRVEMPNPGRRLRHRLSADVRATVLVNDTLSIPRSAVLTPGGRPRVFVELTPGRYTIRSVRLGRVGDSLVEILAGVSPGERVVSQGGFLLDAQAQLAGVEADDGSIPSAANTNAVVVAVAATHTDLSTSETAAIRTFVQEADAAGHALAEDNLHAFHGRLDALRTAAKGLPGIVSLDALSDVASLVPEVRNAGTTLAEARKAFYPLSQRLVAIGRQLRTRTHGFDDLHLFQCPMTRRAFPDAPSSAAWIQFDRVQHNPWFGREMPDCGTELQP